MTRPDDPTDVDSAEVGEQPESGEGPDSGAQPVAAANAPGADASVGGEPEAALEAEAAEAAGDAEAFEGPRRRARRERAERRAAQERALAIERARREARRRFRDRLVPTRHEPVTLGAVRGLRSLVAIVLAAITTTVIGLVLYFSPVLSTRNVEVLGTEFVTADEVLDVARIRLGTPLLQVNTAEVAERVAAIRRVASARVQRHYPSAMRISVVERVAVAVKDYPDGPHLFDRDGVDFATDPPPVRVAHLDVDDPGPGDPATRAALQVMTALRPEVADQVERVAAPSVASITLTLIDGRTVVWGGAERTAEKAEKLTALLTQPGQAYDVSSPDLPTVR